jgi:hypothetical protein
MESIKTKQNHRVMVIINYLSFLTFVVLFEYFRNYEAWNLLSSSAIGASFLVFVISFYSAYGKTGAWKQAHRPFSRMDEREAGIAYESLRIAYAVFSVIVLTVLLVYALGKFPVSIIVFAGLLLMAHLLPASILVWRK